MEDLMKLRSIVRAGAGLLALSALLLTAPVQASQPAIDFTGYNHQHIGSNFTIGWSFEVGADDIVVKSLGVFDLDDDGLLTSHDVGIWSGDGTTLLGTATVGSGVAGTLDNKFRYVSIADLVLNANTTYLIGATSSVGLDEFALGLDPLTLTGLTVDPSITLLQSQFADNGGNPALLAPTNTSAANTLFAGPNFKFDIVPPGGGGGGGGGPVPEPGTVALLIASGFSGVGVMVRGRRIRK